MPPITGQAAHGPTTIARIQFIDFKTCLVKAFRLIPEGFFLNDEIFAINIPKFVTMRSFAMKPGTIFFFLSACISACAPPDDNNPDKCFTKDQQTKVISQSVRYSSKLA